MHDLLLLEAITREDSLTMERTLSEEFGTLSICDKNEGLLTAVKLGRRVFAERLIFHAVPADIECEDQYGNTPLILAAASGERDIARTLIKRGCDLDAENNRGRTALHEAVWIRCTSIVRLLLRSGCDIDAQDNKNLTPLMLCADQGFPDILQLLLRAGCDVTKMNHPEGYTALHLAAREGNLDCVKILLQNFAEIEALDKWMGITALGQAIANNRYDVVAWLIEQHGANIQQKDRFGRSMLHLAVTTGNESLIELVLKQGVPVNDIGGQRKLTPLMDVFNLKRSKVNILRLLIRFGTNINIKCKENIQRKYIEVSPLECAIYKGQLEEAKLLHHFGGFMDLKRHELCKFNISIEMQQWLESVSKKPRALIDLSSNVISTCLSSSCDHQLEVKKLPIPFAIQNFLCP